MSLCVAIIKPDSTYIACDSRNVIVLQKNPVNNECVNSIIKSDESRKFAKLNIDGRTIIAVTAGISDFCGNSKSFSGVLDEITFKRYDNLQEIANVIASTFMRARNNSNEDIHISLFEYVGSDSLNTAEITVNNGCTIFCSEFSKGDNIPYITANGDKWAKTALDYMLFNAQSSSEELTIDIINSAYTKLERIGAELNNTVGGQIRILKLSPNNYEWLQNGYSLDNIDIN